MKTSSISNNKLNNNYKEELMRSKKQVVVKIVLKILNKKFHKQLQKEYPNLNHKLINQT